MTTIYIQMGADTVDAATVTVPSDRTFRDAWVLDGSVIEVDMAAARDIHRDRIRAERESAFDPFDKISIPLTRKMAGGTALTAQEQAELNAAELNAQKLRDAPAHADIDGAATPDELKALTLSVLTA